MADAVRETKLHANLRSSGKAEWCKDLANAIRPCQREAIVIDYGELVHLPNQGL